MLMVGKAFTVTVTTLDVAEVQGVLVTMALKYFVAVSTPIVAAGSVVVVTPVPVMLVKFILSVEDCHCMVPVFPDNVILAGLVPVHIL